MRSNFNDKKEKRISRYKGLAAKNNKLSDSYSNKANDIARMIPPGQPILVGHHSERRHRSDLKKIDNAMRNSSEAYSKAKYYTEKAIAAENNNAISSDDPNALNLLREKLQRLEAMQLFMKEANKCIKKKDKEKFLLLDGATDQLWTLLNTPDCMRGIGFPSYKLQNNNQVINTTKKRIAILEAQAGKEDKAHRIGDTQVIENYSENRVQILFPGKPSDSLRTELKQNGFRWSPSQGTWQRNINSWALKLALEIAEKY